MLNAILCIHSDAYILFEGVITIVGQGADDAAIAADRNDKKVVFKNCVPFMKCMSKINNAEVDNAEYLDIVMLMYNLFEYSESYAKTLASLWQFYRDEPDYNVTNSKSFKFKMSITDNTNNVGIVNVKMKSTFGEILKYY